MWCEQDALGFKYEINNNTGQIKAGHSVAKYIYELSKMDENTNLMEIGTWNGLGSTRFFIEAMMENKKAIFYSLENNSDKVKFAREYWDKHITDHKLNVHFLNATIVSGDELREFVDKEFSTWKDDEQTKKWINIDIENSQNTIESPFKKIDVLLIDGGEWNGQLEFEKLKDITKYIILDDIGSFKNMKNYEFMKDSPDFELIFEDLAERHGTAAFKNLKFS
jgi:hypothetical protein